MKYIREFIELKQDAPGYALGSTKISGNCKFEVLHGKVKMKLSLKNLKKSNNTYTIDVIKTEEDKNIGVNLGELEVKSDGRSQFSFQKELTNSLDSQVLKDFDVIVIMAKKEDNSGKRDLITPAVGYRRERLLWRKNFRYYNEEDPFKKFQLNIEDAIEEEKDTELESQPLDVEEDGDIVAKEAPMDDVQMDEKVEKTQETMDAKEDGEVDEEVSSEDEKDDEQEGETVVIEGNEIIDNVGQSIIKDEDGGESGIEGEEIERQERRRQDVIVKYIDYDENSCKGKKKRRITREQEVKNLEHMKELLDIKEIHYQPKDLDTHEEEEEEIETREEDKIEESTEQETVGSVIPKRFSRKADEMFTTYPRLTPFEEKEGAEEWIRIEPRDIAIFPINTWRLMNNPFLMNGYYKHHHILLGEKLDLNDGYYYLIAVPAQYNPRQKRLANVHGFEYFRSCRKVNPRTGEFGYWIKEIRI
ncbi:DUF7922 domain-containing protein [Vallitalea okinawensis]|uniref:DUF7922 domain-containing protein n=1 Tax=Vallitalea okinawensis TaxID=2078660 RepID=UPI0013005F71|nr:hypothetical protein [Vallitalea okinawensis]